MYIDTIIQYGVFSVGLTATLVLFLALKKDIRSLAEQHQRRINEVKQRLEEAESRAEEQLESSPQIQTVGSGFNMNHRVQALRLLRRGEDVGHVAAALGVSRSEVELLVRVQKLGAARLANRP